MRLKTLCILMSLIVTAACGSKNQAAMRPDLDRDYNRNTPSMTSPQSHSIARTVSGLGKAVARLFRKR